MVKFEEQERRSELLYYSSFFPSPFKGFLPISFLPLEENPNKTQFFKCLALASIGDLVIPNLYMKKHLAASYHGGVGVEIKPLHIL